MEQTTAAARNARATAYFAEQVESLRRQLDDTQRKLNYYRGNAAKLKKPDRNTDAWIDQLSRKERDLKQRLNRALFNAGRL